MDWDVIEMNASDSRNEAAIRAVAGAGSANQTFSPTGEFLSSARGRRKLIVIDEADNLFGREDKGGGKAITETIRESSQPIMLIVNDYDALARKVPAIRTLAEVVVFRRLSQQEIVRVLKEILRREGIESQPEVLEKVATNAAGDLRAAINDLQMMATGKKTLSTADLMALGKRNQEKELKGALAAMFRADTVRGARDATLDLDESPEDLILWIEENVPLELRGSDELSLAFDSISRSDVYLGRTQVLQHYGLWSYAKELMTGGVTLSRRSKASGYPPEYRYPGHIIMLSRAKAPKARRNAVARKLASYLHTSKRCVLDGNLDLISSIARRDPELLCSLASRLQLDVDGIAFLLGEKPDSPRVAEVAARSGAGTVDSSGRGTERSRRDLSHF